MNTLTVNFDGRLHVTMDADVKGALAQFCGQGDDDVVGGGDDFASLTEVLNEMDHRLEAFGVPACRICREETLQWARLEELFWLVSQ